MRLFLWYALLLTVASCSYDEEPTVVDIAGGYQVKVPSYMEEVDDLNERALVQYENDFRSRYAIVLKRENGIQEELQRLLSSLEKAVIIDSASMEVNDMPAREYRLSGLVTDERVYYDIVFYETPQQDYQLVMWTRDDKKEGFLKDMEQIKLSFRQSTN